MNKAKKVIKLIEEEEPRFKKPEPGEIEWRKAPSVTTGGKAYFWVTFKTPQGGKRWVVWDRVEQQWAVTDEDNKPLGFFKTDKEGKKAVEDGL
jgi:hypothetical protein